MLGYVTMKSLSITGTKGPRLEAEMLSAEFSSEKGRERRQDNEVPFERVEAQEVLVTRVL